LASRTGTQADPRLIVVADEAALAARTAQLFAEAAERAIEARGTFAVALAGGSTPKAAYALLAQAPLRDRIDWPRVRIFFGDERCVPPVSDESNAKMARETLLDHVPIPAGNIYRMTGEDAPESAALAYERTLSAVLGAAPRFDLVLLGLGPDAHTASLFPGSEAIAEQRRLAVAVYVAKLGAHRLTLTPPVLNAAREIAVATAGSAKAEALRHALSGPLDPQTYPIQIIRPKDGSLTFLVDEAAAAGVNRSEVRP
jgi:6-phosphogluconolactonase